MQNTDLPSLGSGAARRIKELRDKEGNPALMLRLTVSGGGCSGFQYNFKLDALHHDDDILIERDGATLVTDESSLEFLKNAEVDFVEDMMGAYFQVKNPNASASCGCGNSFSVKMD